MEKIPPKPPHTPSESCLFLILGNTIKPLKTPFCLEGEDSEMAAPSPSCKLAERYAATTWFAKK